MSKKRGSQHRSKSSVAAGPSTPDPRVTYSPITAVNGEPIPPGALATLQAVATLPDGRELVYPGPNVAGFNLVEAHRHHERAMKLRAEFIRNLRHQLPDGRWQTADARRTFDYLSSATSAVLMAFTAIEGIANALIDRLPEDATVEIERRGDKVECRKDAMVRSLSISEKIELAVPMNTGKPSIKGTGSWEKFKYLKRLRDDLVHVKQPHQAELVLNAHARLMHGDGDTAVADAVAIVEAIAPDWLTESARQQLDLAKS